MTSFLTFLYFINSKFICTISLRLFLDCFNWTHHIQYSTLYYVELSHNSPGLYNALTAGLTTLATNSPQKTQSAEEHAAETMKQMKRIEDVFTLAEQRRKAAEAKRIEKSGGFKFDQSLKIPMTFTFGSPTANPPQHPQPGHVQQTAQQSPPQPPVGFAFAPSGMANPFITPPHNNTVPPGGPTFCFPPRTTQWIAAFAMMIRWERVQFWPLNLVARHLMLLSQLYIHSLVHSNRLSINLLDRLNYSFTRSACIHLLLNLSINILQVYQLCVRHSRLTHNSWFVLYCLIHTCCSKSLFDRAARHSKYFQFSLLLLSILLAKFLKDCCFAFDTLPCVILVQFPGLFLFALF